MFHISEIKTWLKIDIFPRGKSDSSVSAQLAWQNNNIQEFWLAFFGACSQGGYKFNKQIDKHKIQTTVMAYASVNKSKNYLINFRETGAW